MLRVTILWHARLFSNRACLFGGVTLSTLAISAVANAQQQPTPPSQQEQKTPSAPAESQQPAPGPPAANSPTAQTQLPQIVVSGGKPKPKPKPKVNLPAPQPVAQDAPTPAQAALNTQMTKMNEARDNNILPKIGATTYTFTRDAIVSMPQGDNTSIDKLVLQFPGVSYEFGRLQSQFPRPKRVRQRSNQDQWRCHSRGSVRIGCPHRHQFYLKDVAADRHLARAVRPAHGRRARYRQQKLCNAEWRDQSLRRQPPDFHA